VSMRSQSLYEQHGGAKRTYVAQQVLEKTNDRMNITNEDTSAENQYIAMKVLVLVDLSGFPCIRKMSKVRNSEERQSQMSFCSSKVCIE